MRPLYDRLRGYLPRRRRRVWRYVSGRRRGVGLVVFASLVLVGYAYWYMTNDARIGREVQRYLSRRTGGRVELERAHFSLFEGIRVNSLRVWLSDDVEEPFFEAPVVFLDHRASGLLLRGRLEPVELVCVQPRITLIEDVETGRLNVMRIFRAIEVAGPAGKPLVRLPAIRLRDGQLNRKDLERGQVLPVGRVKGLTVALLPHPSKLAYDLRFEGPEEGEATMRGSGTIDLVSGQTHVTGLIGLERLDDALPRRYRQWRQRYKLTGSAKWTTQARVEVASASAPGKLERGLVKLADVSLELPEEEGGVKLVGVTGDLAFDQAGVDIKKLTGWIAKAGGAAFTLSGRYRGYGPDSPFEVRAEVRDLPLPFAEELAGVWGRSSARLAEQLRPTGPIAVDATIRRDEDRRMSVTGSVRLLGVSIVVPDWPIRVEDVRGEIRLEGDALTLVDLRGRHGQAVVIIAGEVAGQGQARRHDITVTARDLPLTNEVRDALPESYRKAWDSFAPRGVADVVVRQVRPAGQDRPSTTVTVRLTGRASLEYSRFPYRIDRAEGEVVLDREAAKIKQVRGSAGPMRCVVSGQVVRKDKVRETQLDVEVTDLPLDERLARALPPKARAAYEACGLSGRAQITGAKITHRTGERLEYDIPVVLTDASICHHSFPYRLEGASGTLKITPRAVDIERLVARHGRAKIDNLRGRVLLEDPPGGMDLLADAVDLPLDSELRQALPPEARRWWDQLAPAGAANVSIRLRKLLPQAEAGAPKPARLQTDYRLVVSPRDMRVCYRHLPIALHRLTGQVVIQPGRVRLKALTGLAGKAQVALDGEIAAGPEGEQADLSVSTGPVPVDEQLISSLPAGLTEALQLRPGGTAALSLTRLRIRRPPGPATRASATAPADAVATRPAPAEAPLAWSWEGRITLDGAVLELGLGQKTVTGRIEGAMGCAGPLESLSADATVALDEMKVGPHRLGKVTAQLSKAESSPVLNVDKIAVEALSGRAAGLAKVRLADPIKYGLSLTVENVDLARLLAGERGDHRPPLELKGLLSGSLRMTATRGDDASRRATGELRISRAELYRLPVPLGFLHLVYLTLPSDSAFHTAEVYYYLRGDTLVFREIHLQGSALSMLGAGTMDVKTEKLKLTFLTGPPHKLPRLAMLSEVIEGLASGLVAVRVTGTLSHPRRKAVPLRNPEATLRELYEPESR